MPNTTSAATVVLALFVLVSATIGPVLADVGGSEPTASTASTAVLGAAGSSGALGTPGSSPGASPTLGEHGSAENTTGERWNRTETVAALDRWAEATGVANESWWNASRVLDALEGVSEVDGWLHDTPENWTNESLPDWFDERLHEWHNETKDSHGTWWDPDVVRTVLADLRYELHRLFDWDLFEAGDGGGAAGFPHLTPYLPDNYLRPDEEATLAVLIANDGGGPEFEDEERVSLFPVLTSGGLDLANLVTSARNVEVQVLEVEGVPIEVRTGVVPLGWVGLGEVVDVPVRVSVDQNAPPGFYEIPVRVSYEVVGAVDENGRVEVYFYEVQTFPLLVEITESARFVVTETAADVQVGSAGLVTFVVENVGFDLARDATVAVTAESADLTFAGGGIDGRWVGDLAPGEAERVAFRVVATDGAVSDDYALRAVVEYTDRDGLPIESLPMVVPVTPLAEQRFAVGDVDASLRVDDEGEIWGTVVNQGPKPVAGAVLVLDVVSESLVPQEVEFALGTLAPGENTTFWFPVDVRDTAEPGPRRVLFSVEWIDAEGDVRLSDPLPGRVAVTDRRDEFDVESLDAEVVVGSSGSVVVAITNTGDEPVRNVNARLFATDPLSTSDDSAFVGSLDPGERAELVFGLKSAGDAQAKEYPVSLDLLYELPTGEAELSRTFQVGVAVVETPTDGFDTPPWLPFVGALLLLLAVLAVVWRRFRRRAGGAGGEGEGIDDGDATESDEEAGDDGDELPDDVPGPGESPDDGPGGPADAPGDQPSPGDDD
ncbi:hypothetical protein [Haloarchaeobius sp. DFWS5]|uniref:COG1361 S-layer family protein n=1 Tax=Haloarchaeobius sp. DFWS5 TaxID=3446114 RepID=UPI003EBFAAFC